MITPGISIKLDFTWGFQNMWHPWSSQSSWWWSWCITIDVWNHQYSPVFCLRFPKYRIHGYLLKLKPPRTRTSWYLEDIPDHPDFPDGYHIRMPRGVKIYDIWTSRISYGWPIRNFSERTILKPNLTEYCWNDCFMVIYNRIKYNQMEPLYYI